MTSTDKITPQTKPRETWFEELPIWKFKEWLQFTGWLLYIANTVAVLVMLGFAAIGAWIGVAPIFLYWLPLGLAAILAVKLIYDVATVRYDIRPAEPIPNANTDLDPFDLVRARVSCRSFQSRDLTPEHLAEIKEFTRQQSAPEKQLGKHPIRFEYIKAPLTVWPVVGGHEFLVAIAPAEYNRMSVIDVGRSLQKVVIHATRMGLSTCWIGPGADQGSVISHLGARFDPAKDHMICVCAVGYASKFKPMALHAMQRSMRWRLPLEKLFTFDAALTDPLDTTVAPFDSYGRCYELCQWSPSSYNRQSTRCVVFVEDGQPVRFDFCPTTASKYYAAVAVGIWCANWEMGCEALDKGGYLAVAPSNTGERVGNLPPCDVSWIVDLP